VASHTGGCRCGRLRYELAAELGPVFNCHCRFCRQIHGAAFTTIAIVPRAAFRWDEPSETLARYRTPRGSVRHFCGTCASPICNHPLDPNALCLVVASLDDDSGVKPWAHFNLESKAPWFVPRDDLPRFDAEPTREEWAALARARAAR
jgi:hypothetical protein